MDKQNQGENQHSIFTIYQTPYPIYEPNAKRANNRRRLYFTILSIICAIVSALLFAFAIVLIIALVHVELSSPGVDFNKLEDNEPVDDWPPDINDCGRAFYTPNVFPGELKTARIINGADVANHSFPWVVSLRRMGKKQHILEHFCAGSIISEDSILTAAHCIHPDEVDYKEVVVVTGIKFGIN